MCQPSRSSSKGVDTRQYASKDAGPKEDGFGGVPHRLEKGTTLKGKAQRGHEAVCSKDAGPKGGGFGGGPTLID